MFAQRQSKETDTFNYVVVCFSLILVYFSILITLSFGLVINNKTNVTCIYPPSVIYLSVPTTIFRDKISYMVKSLLLQSSSDHNHFSLRFSM